MDKLKNMSCELNDIIIDEKTLKTEYYLRKDIFKYKTINPEELDDYIKQNWTLYKKLKRTVKIKKEKNFDEKLENRFWSLLYKMNYSEMNKGKDFKIPIIRRKIKESEKIIDIFAKDEETIIIAECISEEELKRRTLKNDLKEFKSYQKPIADAIRKHYGEEYSPKILWFFVTQNIIWSQDDKDDAKKYNINIITDIDLPYYEGLAEHLKKASKYQFLAEFLAKTRIPELENIKVPATKGKLAGNIFYSFTTTPRHLLKISFVNHRSIKDPDGMPTYQRIVQKSRLNKISQFIQDGGYFPTNILINFSEKVNFEPIEKNKKMDVKHGNLILPSKYKSAWIIDGQHRLYGYSNIEDDSFLDQNIFVLAFEKMKHEDEAKLFITINQEQKSVPKTIIDSLEGELKWGSNKASERLGAIATRIIDSLDSSLESSIYNRVASEGVKKSNTKCLTLPQLKEGIKKSQLIGYSKNNEIIHGILSDKSDNDTLTKSFNFLQGYLYLIENSNSHLHKIGKSSYLWNNIGFRAHLLLIKNIFDYLSEQNKVDYSKLDYKNLLDNIHEIIAPLLEYFKNTNENLLEKEFKGIYGEGAPKEYMFKYTKIIKKKHPNFSPNDFNEWENEQKVENIKKADEQVKKLNLDIQRIIFDKLKEKYGDGEENYWEKGIHDNKIKISAYQKQLEDNEGKNMPKEHYLDFIQYKKIIEHKEAWNDFKSAFNIKMELEQKGRTKYLSWMDKLNEIRKIYAHPTEERTYKIEHYNFLDWICNELDKRDPYINE